jgi:putative endonuclease
MSRRHLTLGQWGEQLAESHLVKAGAQVLLRNYRSEWGEIDLVVMHEGELVGVEVKTRTLLDVEAPEEAVRRAQLRRIAGALGELAVDTGLEDLHWRVDVVAIEVDPSGALQRLEHFRDAYPP